MLLMSGNDVVIMMTMSMMRMMVDLYFRSKQESFILGPVRIRGEPGNPSGASRSLSYWALCGNPKHDLRLSRGVGPLVSPSAALPLSAGVCDGGRVFS